MANPWGLSEPSGHFRSFVTERFDDFLFNLTDANQSKTVH